MLGYSINPKCLWHVTAFFSWLSYIFVRLYYQTCTNDLVAFLSRRAVAQSFTTSPQVLVHTFCTVEHTRESSTE